MGKLPEMWWDTAKKLTREVGADLAIEKIRDEQQRITVLEQALDLPGDFRFMDKEDYYGFAGAERFSDGVRPVIGTVVVELDDDRIVGSLNDMNREGPGQVVVDERKLGQTEEVTWVVSGYDRENGKSQGLSGFMVDGFCFHRVYDSREAALAVLHLIVDRHGPVKFSTLAALGFEQA